jgi:ABC-type Na+ transport system ATPase subunit NatA
MQNLNITNRFNTLNQREKLFVYLIPAIVLFNIVYVLNTSFDTSSTTQNAYLQERLSTINIQTKKVVFQTITISEIENIAKETIVINTIINNENSIKLNAKSTYKNMLEFILHLQKLDVNIQNLKVMNDNDYVVFTLILNTKGNKNE